MKLRLQNLVLGLAAAVCFVESFVAPRDSDPGSIAAAVMGVVLVRRAIVISPQPNVVIVAGCVMTALVLLGDHALVHINNPIWIVLMLISAVCYALWERIEKALK
jgi:hypothetical protein